MSNMFRRSTRRRRSSRRSRSSDIMDLGRGSAAKNMEKLFMAAAEKGDKKAMILALENKAHFSTDCVDKDGRSALVIAIHNRNLEIIKLLLDNDIGLGDALLRATDIQYAAAVEMICESIKNRHLLPDALYCRALNGDLHPDITPVILAAHHNSYDVLKILIEYGSRIEDPDTYFTKEEFTLQQSVGMINIYKALASEAFMSLTAEDPIKRSFVLSHKFRELSERNYEFRSQYEELAAQCEQYAADLLSHVRDSTEQAIVLSHDPEAWSVTGKFNEPHKVQTAIRYHQQKFVAHPHCQQRLIERWYFGLPNSWRKQSQINTLMFTLIMGICFPILNVCYMIAPDIKLSRLLKIPYVKFVCTTASSMLFLMLLGMQAVGVNKAAYSNYTIIHDENGSTPVFFNDEEDLMKPPSISEILIVFWVIGYTWQEIVELWKKGPQTVKENVSWKAFDFLTLSLYWAWIALRITTTLHAYFNGHTISPIIASDGIFESIPVLKDSNDSNVLPIMDLGSSGNDAIDIDAMADDEDLPYLTVDFIPPDNVDVELSKIFEDANLCHQSFKYNLTSYVRAIILKNTMKGVNAYKAAREEKDDSNVPKSRTRRAAKRINKGTAGGGEATEGEENMANYPRQQMTPTDPILVAEAMFALAKVFSFLRLTRITVVLMSVGPMQISLGRMMIDIVRFLIIFSFVWFAFSIGLNQLYFYHSYENSFHCDILGRAKATCHQPYGSVGNSLATLFWALFGMTELTSLNIKGTDHWFTENVGRLLFAAYNILAIVVLLNVLIAMMSNTYTRIEEDADMQWKFSRSSLWMSFYDETNTISPPFNFIPSVSSFKNILKNMKSKWNGGGEDRKRKKQNIFLKKDKEYKDIVQQLVQRYIFEKRRSGDDEDGDPLLMQLKDDISGFKYDMFEALTDMDNKMREMKSQIEHREPPPDDPIIGSEMFQALHDVIANEPPSPKPIGPETFKHWGSIHLIDEADEALLDEDSEEEASETTSMHTIKID